MNIHKCFDCGTDNSVYEIGSFLCDECRAKEFERLRRIVKGEQEMKTNREIVVELSKKGLKPKEISEKTGIPVKTVYNYRHFSKDEIESDSKPKEKEVSFNNNDYEKLQLEHNKLKEEKEEILIELDNFKHFHKREIELYQKENKSLINQLKKEKEKHDLLLKYIAMVSG